jgi:hypothetical protein
MAVSLKDIYDDLKRFKNPKTNGPMSEKGRNPNKYDVIKIYNTLATSQMGFGGGLITWTGLAEAMSGGAYPVSIKFAYESHRPIILSESSNNIEGYIRLEEIKDNKYIFIPEIDFNSTTALMRCGCRDFRFRFMWWLQKQGGLIGGAKTYITKNLRPPINPNQTMGLCKHLNSMVNALQYRNVIK